MFVRADAGGTPTTARPVHLHGKYGGIYEALGNGPRLRHAYP